MGDATWMWFTAVPTYGSLVIGFGIMTHYLIGWWPTVKGLRDWREWVALLPFASAYGFGVLLILGVGGLVGLVANVGLWGVGWVGDGALIFGMGGSRQVVGQGPQRMALGNGGLAVVLFLTFVFAGLAAKSEKLRMPIQRGVASGILTGTVASVSSLLAVPLASAVNGIASLFPGVSA